jgi:hypothetical protein
MAKLNDVIDPIYVPEEFQDLEVVYDCDWSSWEENGWIVVFKFFDELMCWEYEYCVMSDDNTIYFDPYPITEEELEKKKDEWAKKSGWH